MMTAFIADEYTLMISTFESNSENNDINNAIWNVIIFDHVYILWFDQKQLIHPQNAPKLIPEGNLDFLNTLKMKNWFLILKDKHFIDV